MTAQPLADSQTVGRASVPATDRSWNAVGTEADPASFLCSFVRSVRIIESRAPDTAPFSAAAAQQQPFQIAAPPAAHYNHVYAFNT